MSSTSKKFPTKFSGYYVSEDGRVYTEWCSGGKGGRRGELREMNTFARGGDCEVRYRAVNISLKDEQGRTHKQIKYYVHRLIAETLLSNPQSYSEIDHINQDKTDNRLENLRWVTKEENFKNRKNLRDANGRFVK